MKAVLALLLGVAVNGWNKEFTLEDLHEVDTVSLFSDWADEFGKTYDNVLDESNHFKTFVDNLYKIGSTNSEGLTYQLALNQFSDLTPEQFKLYVHGEEGRCYKSDENLLVVGEQEQGEAAPAPASVDWTTKGVVTPVKNQGQCGSCWAFSATGAIECQYAIQKGKLNSLSEQQLVDCAGSRYGCAGCNGGQMTGAMQYAADDKGLCTESEYSYTGRNGQCKSSSCGTKYDANRGYTGVTKYSSSALETATAAGCISIGIEADQTAFQHYSSGVLTGTCGTRIDHGVLVVGYGTSGSQQYWKVKNSWGRSWGMQGYILICRNCNKNGRDGECGILMEPNIPTF